MPSTTPAAPRARQQRPPAGLTVSGSPLQSVSGTAFGRWSGCLAVGGGVLMSVFAPLLGKGNAANAIPNRSSAAYRGSDTAPAGLTEPVAINPGTGETRFDGRRGVRQSSVPEALVRVPRRRLSHRVGRRLPRKRPAGRVPV